MSVKSRQIYDAYFEKMNKEIFNVNYLMMFFFVKKENIVEEPIFYLQVKIALHFAHV